MKKEIVKFLEFEGKSIHFLAENGEYLIAIQPICEVLGIDCSNEITKIEDSDFLKKHLSEQSIVSVNGELQKMACLPERIIYGWLFNIESDAPGLLDYKMECFAVLDDNPTTQSMAAKIF